MDTSLIQTLSCVPFPFISKRFNSIPLNVYAVKFNFRDSHAYFFIMAFKKSKGHLDATQGNPAKSVSSDSGCIALSSHGASLLCINVWSVGHTGMHALTCKTWRASVSL